jgi:SH3 domain-containing YSC84-like protein 1
MPKVRQGISQSELAGTDKMTAAGAASMKGVAGVFAYSKTKGAFAGVSLEGSVLIERRDANQKMYNGRITARQLLEGAIRPPPSADPLMNVLNTRVFSGNVAGADSMYNDIPVYDDNRDNVVWEGRSGDAYGAGVRTNRSNTVGSRNGEDEYEYRDNPKRANTWQDDVYDQGFNSPQRTGTGTFGSRANPSETFDNMGNRRSRASTLQNDYTGNSFGDKPARPTAPKPIFRQKTGLGDLKSDQAVALFTFEGEQDGDLSFKKNDIITITKRTENKSDWWTGRSEDGRVGIFPSNYVEAAS